MRETFFHIARGGWRSFNDKTFTTNCADSEVKARTQSKSEKEGLGYPRPQFRRQAWISLDGRWDFAIDAEAKWKHPHDVSWDRDILVPFAPETPRSGIAEMGFYKACWYRRMVHLPTQVPGRRLILHFGAVDYTATLWVN